MGRIFKTPSDDSTESTLRAIHVANTLDTAYERGWGWLKTIIASFITVFVVSALEYHGEYSIWEHTADWAGNKITGWLSGWF